MIQTLKCCQHCREPWETSVAPRKKKIDISFSYLGLIERKWSWWVCLWNISQTILTVDKKYARQLLLYFLFTWQKLRSGWATGRSNVVVLQSDSIHCQIINIWCRYFTITMIADVIKSQIVSHNKHYVWFWRLSSNIAC